MMNLETCGAKAATHERMLVSDSLHTLEAKPNQSLGVEWLGGESKEVMATNQASGGPAWGEEVVFGRTHEEDSGKAELPVIKYPEAPLAWAPDPVSFAVGTTPNSRGRERHSSRTAVTWA